MSKKHTLFIALIALAGLAASFLLMPGSQEVALMQMKDKHFEEARLAYEEQLAQGNLNIEVVTRLSELYLQTGEIDKAIAVMEKFIESNPMHLDARRTLGTYYQYAQRQDDYMRNLEEINKLQPRPENLKTLSDIYNFNTQYDKQAETLKVLVDAGKGTQPADYIDLASIYASEKNYPAAINTLQALRDLHPESFTFAQMEMLVTLLFDNRQQDEALAEAQGWIKSHPEAYDDSARLMSIVLYRGNVLMAQKLMAHYSQDQIDASSELTEVDVLLMIAEGRDDEAYARLKELHAQNKLSPELHKNLLFFALRRSDTEFARELFNPERLASYSESDLIALAELAIAEDEPWLLSALTQLSADAEYARNMPVLAAVLAIGNHAPDASQKIDALDKLELRNDQQLQIARICARSNQMSCVEHFLAKLPEAQKLTDQEVAHVGDLYLDIRSWDKGLAFMAAAGDRNSPDIERVRVKYAAVRGDVDAVEKYLAANKDSISQRTLNDLYFAAINNKQLVTAVTVAEFYNERFPGAQSRSYLSYAYLQTGQHEQAVKLLREQKPMSEDDENNYIVALGKLSRHNPEYRKELTQFAGEKLRSKDISKKQKMALVYALIAIKEIDLVMPYIRELALSEGGQWAALYAETLDKQGKHEEARTFWVTLAKQLSTTAKQKREIGFTLLNHGYKEDALPIFTALAEQAKPGSTAMKELLFLWGPRPAPQQMAWLETHYRNAPDNDKTGWAKIISEYGSSDYLIAFAKRNPGSSRHKEFLGGYMEALAQSGALAEQGPLLRAEAEARGDAPWLREYGRMARAYGFNSEARNAYEALIVLDTSDDAALRDAGVIAFAQADYSLARLYLDQYVDIPTDFAGDRQAYMGLFHYGELMRREKQQGAARPYYHETIKLIDTQNQNSAEALSIKAQSQIWAGDSAAGLATFESARKLYPNDDILRADHASALIELKRYDQARALLKQPLAAQQGPAAAEISLPPVGDEVASYSLLERDTALLVQFTDGSKQHRLNSAELKAIPWIAGMNEGYDTLLITAKPGYALQISKLGEEPSLRAVAGNSPQGDRQTQLRYALLTARTDLETGHVYDATSRLNELLPQHTNDPQLMGFIANAENYGGNWPRAQQLLAEARALAPENEDLAILDREMRRLNAPNVKLDHEWVKRGSSHEQITTLSGFAHVTDDVLVGAEIKNDHVQAKTIRRADGRTGNFNGERQHAEIYALAHGENGQRAKLSFYANNDAAGLGGAYSFLNPLGESTLSVEWGKPYWEFIEGVLDDATRDRIALSHIVKPDNRLTLTVTPSYNRYNTDAADNVISTVGADFDAVYRLLDEQPFLAVAYGLDAEYQLTEKKAFDDQGNFTKLFPLRTREIHFLSFNMGYDFAPDTYGEMLLGYGYDRFGGQGPAGEVKLTHEFDEQFDAQIRAYYGIDNSSTDDNISRIGSYVRWRF